MILFFFSKHLQVFLWKHLQVFLCKYLQVFLFKYFLVVPFSQSRKTSGPRCTEADTWCQGLLFSTPGALCCVLCCAVLCCVMLCSAVCCVAVNPWCSVLFALLCCVLCCCQPLVLWAALWLISRHQLSKCTLQRDFQQTDFHQCSVFILSGK